MPRLARITQVGKEKCWKLVMRIETRETTGMKTKKLKIAKDELTVGTWNVGHCGLQDI